jgi:hypothetical protein
MIEYVRYWWSYVLWLVIHSCCEVGDVFRHLLALFIEMRKLAMV